LLQWLICDDKPFVSVESKHLRQIFRLLKPHVSIFGADTMKNDAMEVFIMERENVSRLLQVILFLLYNVLIFSNVY